MGDGMDSDCNFPKNINGINLNNYVPQKRSYNSVEFIHKKYFESLKPCEEKKERTKPKKIKKCKQDKSQQFNYNKNEFKDNTYKFISADDNPVLEQTIKFAKNIVPLVIPPSEDKSQVYYTIKTAKKHKMKEKRSHETNSQYHGPMPDKEASKKVIETYKKVKKESFSIKESISHSENTLDDLNNQSMYTLSDVSERKCRKKDKSRAKKGHKFAISESFDAVATEATPGDTQIKIHLMNDKEKHFLSDNIKEPVINAIKDCLSELMNYNLNTDMTTVQELVKCNSEKLDYVLDKLTCIENKLDSHEKKLDEQGQKFDDYQKKLDNQAMKLDTQENKLDSQKEKLDTQESKLIAQKKKLDTQETILDSYEKRLHTYEKEFNTYMNNSGTSDDIKVKQQKVPDSKPKAKASTLENLGEDLIDIEEEFSSEEELHHELLDRRSKSTVVVELNEEKGDKKLESLGGGEVPRSVKGASTIGAKLERPARPSARFCWTDVARNN